MARLLESLLQDVRYGWRLLAARPPWTAAAVLCLAIASGANTAAFTLVNGLLLRPLPFPDADRLAMIALKEVSSSSTRPFSLREYNEISENATDVASLIAHTYFPLSLSASDGARMAQAELVSGNYFDTLGVHPFAGRFPNASARVSNMPEAVVSHALWRSRFNADPDLPGQIVRVNGRDIAIAGVAPPGFVGATQLIAADLWLPAAMYPALAETQDADAVPMFGVMARLKPMVTLDSARERLSALVVNLSRARDATTAPGVVVSPATGFGVPPVARRSIFNLAAYIFGLMALLIAVAGANVAALVLARGTGRKREIGVRLALGASRGRIAQQLLIENLLLAIVGNAAGVMVAVWLTGVLAAQITTPFSYVSYAVDVSPDVRVFFYSALATAVTAILCGFIPLRHAARLDLVAVIKRTTIGSPNRPSFRAMHGLLVGQFAVSTMLLVGAALLVRTYINMQSVQPGFSTAGLIEVSLDVSQLQLDEAAGRRLYATLSSEMASLPGVQSVALVRDAPLTAGGSSVQVVPSSDRDDREERSFDARSTIVTPDYFRTLGARLVQGQDFGTETRQRTRLAVINQTMARRLSKDGDLIGRSFSTAPGRESIRIAGVVADLSYRSLTEPPEPMFYEPFAQRYSSRMTALIRSGGDAGALVQPIGETIRRVNPDLAVIELRTLEHHMDQVRAQRGVPATVIVVVAVLGLGLAVIGLYGVASYAVRERARELSIRLALGAPPSSVIRLVVVQGLVVLVAGALLGGTASLGLMQVLRGMLVGVSPGDPIAFASVALVLSVAALAALYLPARWASRIDPAATLRAE